MTRWEVTLIVRGETIKHVVKADDFDGLKLRVIPNPVFLETFKAFKANPLPMPFAELYGALESRAVDGQENPPATILASKFYEVQKYLPVGQRVWQLAFTPDQKTLLTTNGTSNDVSIIDVAAEKARVAKS